MFKKISVMVVLAAVLFTVVYAAGEKNSKVEGKASDTKQAVNVTASVKTGKAVTFLEFGSTTCMPCKMMEPILEEVRAEYPHVDVTFIDVMTDEGNALARKYKVRGIPTQVFLDKAGNEYDRHVGFFPKAQLVKVLERGLAQ